MTDTDSSRKIVQAPFLKRGLLRNALMTLALTALIFSSGITVNEMSGVEAYTNLITGLSCVALIFLHRRWVLVATVFGLALGLTGLPPFPEGHQGVGFLLGGAGGYYLAPLVMASLGGLLYQRTLDDDGYPDPKRLALGLLLGLLAASALGTAWLLLAGEEGGWGKVIINGTLWQGLSLLFQGLIAFSVSFFVRNEARKREFWKARLSEYRRKLDDRDQLFESLDRRSVIFDSPDPDEETVEDERKKLRRKEEEDGLPPWVKL